MKSLLTAALVATLAGPAIADPAGLVKEGLNQCFLARGEARKAKDALVAAGWDFEGISGTYWLFEAPRKNAIGGVRGGTTKDKGCVFGAKGMSVADGERIAQSFVKAQFGARVNEASGKSLGDARVARAWMASVGGKNVMIAVFREMVIYPIYRGAVIVMVFD